MRIITDVTAVTVDERRRIITGGAIAIDGERIAAIDRTEVLRARYLDAEIVDGQGMVAIPGLIDTHAHADQSLLRGLGDAMHWHPFLDRIIGPYLAEREPADGVLANMLSMIEMIRGGTTCFVSPNADPRDDYGALSEAVADIGIRAVFCRFIMAKEDDTSAVAAKQVVADAVEVMERWHGAAGGRLSMWFGLDVPRRPGDRVYPAFYKEVADESRRIGVGISYHFCSEIEDSTYIQNTYGMRPAEWSRDHHALGSNVLLINGCWLTPLEMRILADTGTHLAHSPVANMKMATGILPLPDVLAAGVNVALGTDGALNNNTHDMFGEMKSACLLQNAVRRSASAMTAATALEMATIGGARAIGRAHELGSLEPGKLADIVLIDPNHAHTLPAHDILSNLVFAAGPRNVDTVIIGGRIVLRNGRLPDLNEAAIFQRARNRAEAIRVQLGLTSPQEWPVVADRAAFVSGQTRPLDRTPADSANG
ncbi:MAG: amidohydrolase [Rhizobiaceae bacterium]|nr:amidohydrolase [Rhizobiaceae bacterium]